MKNQKIIAVIPAHNEEKYIENVVKETKKYVDVVIVVDDASTDNTGKLAKNAGAIVLRHVVNLYKGSALKTGCEAAIILGADKIIMLDGDGQHDPHEIPQLIIELDQHDFVIGSRDFDKNMPLNSKLGNNFLSALARLLYNVDIKDTQSGYRAFNVSIYPKIEWSSRDYGVETEQIKKLSKYKISHSESKVKTIYHDNYKGATPLDGIKIAAKMIGGKFS